MRHNSCKYKNECKYFHPKKLKIKNEDKKTEPSQKNQEENLTYAKAVTRNLQAQGNFLGQTANQHLVGLPVQNHQPLSQPNHTIQQPTVVPQNSQKQILDLLMSLNQRMSNLENQKIQM